MHTHSLERYRHSHDFLGADHERNERRSWMVIGLCAIMMVAEIAGGLIFGSMALIADGLHMSTHAGAFLITALAYSFAWRHRTDERFCFGTGKFGDLAAFTSAIILAIIALLIGYESITRILQPVPIAFNEAIPIAIVGLAVNLISALLLRHDHGHGDHDHGENYGHDHGPVHAHHHDHSYDHSHGHAHDDGHAHGVADEDLNLRAAYVHVLADAAVSVLAVVGLVVGRQFGILWLDPIMGLIGTGVIASWSIGLLRSAGAVLLDLRADPMLAAAIRARLEVDDDLVSDLHLWRLGPGHAGVVATIVTCAPQPPAFYKARLKGLTGLSHVTVEVVPCPEH
ncbi:MAG: CDF family Co(II)/Ni(II) efflux transporter DmeF [Methylovirgula sp.]